ncbi:MAG TPA: GatB/YqeY domain-containing protein [Gemmatimonadota bacterium]|nr:GatB/YqeY domain-containing protein [Gemmatimonadota bacterium]
MSDVLGRIREDQNAALKAGDKVRLATLRLIANDLKNRQIELGRPLEEADFIEVLTRARKQRRESEDQYRSGGRQDLADREAAEAVIIQEYLPEPVDPARLGEMIDASIAEIGATGPADMGKVMKDLMPRLKGRVDGAELSRKVRERLS